MRGVYCYFRILRGRVRRTRGVYCHFRIFSLFLLNFIQCHIAMPFYMFFSALVFFIYLLYIYVLFRSYIYIIIKLKKYSIHHGNVAMVARVFSKVLLFEKNFYNICLLSKKPLPSLPYCHDIIFEHFLRFRIF
jgi:hypothetical protein